MRRALLGSLFLVACGDPVNVSGRYSVSLTNRENGCQFQNWREGDTTQNVPLDITQVGSEITGVVGGIPGAFLVVLLGSATFTGQVSGTAIDMTLYGKNQARRGECSYTINARATGSLMGDFLGGSIAYTTATNGHPDCEPLRNCHTRQAFNGTRPPTR